MINYLYSNPLLNQLNEIKLSALKNDTKNLNREIHVAKNMIFNFITRIIGF